jgi:hypothetical protein
MLSKLLEKISAFPPSCCVCQRVFVVLRLWLTRAGEGYSRQLAEAGGCAPCWAPSIAAPLLWTLWSPRSTSSLRPVWSFSPSFILRYNRSCGGWSVLPVGSLPGAETKSNAGVYTPRDGVGGAAPPGRATRGVPPAVGAGASHRRGWLWPGLGSPPPRGCPRDSAWRVVLFNVLFFVRSRRTGPPCLSDDTVSGLRSGPTALLCGSVETWFSVTVFASGSCVRRMCRPFA